MRQIFLSTAKVAISATLLYLALHKLDFADLASRLDLRSVAWIGLAIVAMLVSTFASALRWREVAAACGVPVGIMTASRYTLIGSFFNQTLPSSIGGDAVRIWLMGRLGTGWRAAAYSVLVDRALGLIALAVLIVGCLPWSFALIDDPRGRVALLLIDLTALAAGLGFLAAGLLPWPHRIAAIIQRHAITRHVHDCSMIASGALFDRYGGPRIALLSFLIHLMAIATAWCAARAISASASFVDLLLLIPPVTLITTLPISIAGWGVREAALGLAFGYAGLSATEGVQVSLLFGATYFIVGALGGPVWILSSEKAARQTRLFRQRLLNR